MPKNVVTLNLNNINYSFRPVGTCSTIASVAEKTVTCAEFSLTTGATILVKFTYSNSSDSPTLNVNSTGAKTIKYRGSNLTNSAEENWKNGDLVEFYFDGSSWILITMLNTKNTAGASDTSEKIYIIGATSQENTIKTFSHDSVYIGIDGCLYSGFKKVSVEDHNHDSIYVTKSELNETIKQSITNVLNTSI